MAKPMVTSGNKNVQQFYALEETHMELEKPLGWCKMVCRSMPGSMWVFWSMRVYTLDLPGL